MKNKKIILFSLLLVAIMFFALETQAHAPSSISLSYDIGPQTLGVTVNHTSDTGHYIESIELWKNDVFVTEETYTSQTSGSQQIDSFRIVAVDGDVLKVRATCSISGSLTEEITVLDPLVPEFGTYLPILFIALIFGIIGLLMYRKRTN